MEVDEEPQEEELGGRNMDFAYSMAKYFLNNSQSKLPIKKSDIVSHVLLGNNKEFDTVLKATKRILGKTYGIEIHEVLTSKSGKQFICISTFPTCSLNEYTAKQRGHLTLQFLVLSYIFMLGGTVYEENLFSFLNKLDIPLEGSHEYFGDNVKKLITETFVRQLYLTRKKIPLETSSEVNIVYSWGFRATIEFPKQNMLKEVAQLFNRPEKCFIQQYKEAYTEPENLESEMD